MQKRVDGHMGKLAMAGTKQECKKEISRPAIKNPETRKKKDKRRRLTEETSTYSKKVTKVREGSMAARGKEATASLL